MKRKSFGGRSHAYSLIELLVVIAVVLILLRILMPALSKVRETGYQVQCANNMRQLGIAFIQHAMDEKIFPNSADGGGDGGNDWIRTNGDSRPRNDALGQGCALGIYANGSAKPTEETVFFCPVYTNDCGGNVGRSYMMNTALRKNRLSDVNDPAGTYVLLEEKEGYELLIGVQPQNCGVISPPSGFVGASINDDSNCGDMNMACGCNRAEAVSRRHKGGSNALFVDGHVRWGPQGRLSADTQDERGCSDDNDANSGGYFFLPANFKPASIW